MSNYIDCHKIMDNPIPYLNRSIKNKKIKESIMEIIKDEFFKEILPWQIKEITKIIDEVYFGGKLFRHVSEKGILLDFRNIGDTGEAGLYKKINDLKYIIGVSKYIINSSFSMNERSMMFYGLECKDRIDCLILIIQHDLIHLIIDIYNPKLNREIHSKNFIKIAKCLFGHTDIKHILICGDTKKSKGKFNIKLGDRIISKLIRGRVYSGIVISLNENSIGLRLDDGKYINIYHNSIHRVIKNAKKPDTNIKKRIKKGDHVKVKIDGFIKTAIVIHTNTTKARVRLDRNGKEWYIPYEKIML